MGSQTSARVTERKTRLDGSVADFLCDALLVEPDRRAALRYVTDREWSIPGAELRIAPGTVTIGHFWVDRPYNVYHWLVSGRTLAYYCNVVTETTISRDLVAYTDLVVDVLVRPSGAATVLDEDELPADLAPAHRLAIAQALDVLVTDPRRLIREVERETKAVLARV